MATQTTLHQFIKWSIIILSLVNTIVLSVDIIQSITSTTTTPLNWHQLMFIGFTYIVFMIPVIGAWKQNYMFLILGGVALVLSIIYSYMGLKSTNELNLPMAMLTVFTFGYALLIRKRDASSLHTNDSFN